MTAIFTGSFFNHRYHMTKITIVKNYRNAVMLKQIDLPDMI